ncbi:MAG: F0F1 ATP synthase subunit delta [Pegethrix bostrychoides GSE-TBD4-15B]|jgi:F-type H+-transporting ATPase subunit delta|uniref:ATP synthase subunit delta n=1 Tax=Pegethrix bostrychoides GSE-TBD4-15B TaxID=2839662 RepID=A0A951PEW7_9CYAN|nr:F0F1 ATP synthase subunit delta [Pegethrix bostrychoides GSE-TBD4-15B]
MNSTLSLTEVAEPYAQALMSVAQSSNITDQIGEDARSLLNLLHESEDFRLLVSSPLIEADKKKAVIRQIVESQVQPYMLNFLMLLVDRSRVLVLPEVCEQYLVLLRQMKQTVLAEVTSAIELNDEQKETIRQKVLATNSASEVELQTRVDPELLGGVVIKVGSQVIDASLRGQLRKISLKLGVAS